MPAEHDVLIRFNNIFKKEDDLYRNAARLLGCSDCEFWILYTLCLSNQPMTQSELCDMQYQPKQTVNSSLKKLEADGYLTLVHKDNRRSKYIELNPLGKKLAANTAQQVIHIELDTFAAFSKEEQDTFLNLYERYADALKEKMQQLQPYRKEP